MSDTIGMNQISTRVCPEPDISSRAVVARKYRAKFKEKENLDPPDDNAKLVPLKTILSLSTFSSSIPSHSLALRSLSLHELLFPG